MMGWASPQWLSWNRAHSREVASVVLIRSELQKNLRVPTILTKSPHHCYVNLEPGPEVAARRLPPRPHPHHHHRPQTNPQHHHRVLTPLLLLLLLLLLLFFILVFTPPLPPPTPAASHTLPRNRGVLQIQPFARSGRCIVRVDIQILDDRHAPSLR